ncbi:hypothetical protein [Amycolatopsis magusensis]|uniref:Uncharacterized protein n=1 Tax=Amycolatopsis magusensis TaxID=882444 RepID=A0ABS4PZV4_9PSEU|nr:hypothetical protein [Amycolatopsis magusensis]MBP2184945.1 hypothetical protein [Amycolatopsis magusensis]
MLLDAAGLAALIAAARGEAEFDGTTAKIRLSTTSEITDGSGTVVCTGEFRWSVRRGPGTT